MPAIGYHESGVPMEGGGFDMDAMRGDGNVGGRPGIDSFPIVYKRRFMNLDALTDPMPPRPSPIVARSNECQTADFAVVPRKGAKQLTLEQFWGAGQTSSKLLDRLPLVSDEAPAPVQQLENADVAKKQVAEKKPVIKRKRVEKPLTIDLNGKPGPEKVHIPGGPKQRKVVRKADKSPEGVVSPNKKRRLGRPPMIEGVSKRGRGEGKARPGKRPKLVLGRNRKLEVENLTNPSHELVEFPGKGLESRESPPPLPIVERTRPNENGSSSGTQTEDDLPARIGSAQARQQQPREVSSEATQSETATETDPDLPQWNGDDRAKEEDDDSDAEKIPIDLNVLPELLMSAKSRRKMQGLRNNDNTEKKQEQHRKRPALKRPEIHQQLQPLDPKQANQVVKSLWPSSRGIPHESLTKEDSSMDPITSKSAKFVSLQHLRSPPVVDGVSKISKPKVVVQPKIAPRVDLPLPVHSQGNGVAKQREMIQHSSSETETESDKELVRAKPVVRFQGMVPQGQCLTNGAAAVSKVSSLPRRDGEDPRSIANKAMPGKLYTKLPVKRTVSDAGPLLQQGVSRKTSLVVADPSDDDSETESDDDIGGLRVSRPKPSPPQIGMNGEGVKSSGILKAKVVRKPENAASNGKPLPSSLVKSVGSTPNVGSVSTASTKKLPDAAALVLPRKVVQRAKIIRSPQVRPLANGVEADRALSRFASRPDLQKKRKQKISQGLEDRKGVETNGCRHSDGVKGSSKGVSKARCSGFHSPLEKSPNNVETTPQASPEAEMPVKLRSKKGVRMVNGVLVGVQGLTVSSKMTPRTRKLTDAMQKFVAQKANRRQWREVDLSKIHPKALIGRSCKVYWPLDDDWYPGVIHDYNPQTKKHRIDYKDNEMEMVYVSKERFKLKLSPEEWVELETSTGEQAVSKPDLVVEPVPEEPAVENEAKLGHGDLVWAKVKGYPMWPALVMDEDHATACGMDPGKKGMVPIQFFGSYDHCRFSYRKLVLFSKGLMHKFHTKCKRVIFVQGLEEVERYLKESRLPDSMAHLLDDGDGGAIERQRQEIEQNWPEPDEQETRTENRRTMMRKRVKRVVTFPLQLGALTIYNLGKVVRDSEHFHDQQYIWPEGYTSIRSFPSAKDPDAFVDYKLQVLRNPLTQSLPMFRVTPADDSPVEGATPYACWKKAFVRLRKAHEKAGKIPELDKRMQFRSAAHMFGFSNPRVSKMIQGLPNARACTKFTNWLVTAPTDEDVEPVLPAGYQPVDISWKHLDRCTVCYLDEEYCDNLLLQCDKCRIMVHMNCYGEQELPDGDLWLCNQCRPDAPKTRPPCCLCPVTSGVLKKTTDGRWAHLMCAMWIPETCVADVKRMEPVDGVNAVSKERWRLTCSVCKVPYGACIQCSVNSCKTAFHPLCARSAGLYMEVLEEKQKLDGETDLRLLAYCRKHKQPTSRACESAQPTIRAKTDCLSYQPPLNSSGCARSEPYHAAARRGRREPEALAAALRKRLFVENLPYRVTGCRQNPPTGGSQKGSLWSMHWESSKGPVDLAALPTPTKSAEEIEVLSMSDKFRRMKSSLSQRLVFGKSAIHGMGVFTKQVHLANDMIIEYAGEVVRPVIADIRERRCYDSLVGAGTYMFRIDDERVVDATHAGSIAHLINHSCEPNCYSRTVTASGEDRIIIFAKRDIAIGEELTYDYRFMSKDEVLTCYCGCAGCRGSVNVVDSDGDPTKMLVTLAELIKLPATTRGHTH